MLGPFKQQRPVIRVAQASFQHASSPAKSYASSAAAVARPMRDEHAAAGQGQAGTIADAFSSVYGNSTIQKLDPRLIKVKKDLVAGREDAVIASWHRLLHRISQKVVGIKEQGSRIIPIISFQDIKSNRINSSFTDAYRNTGVCIVRDVLENKETLNLKSDLQSYIATNRARTNAFPSKEDPQVFELYWSPSQIRARSHPNMIATQRFLMSFWSTAPNSDSEFTVPISTRHPVAYSDRLRIRQPGDQSFALGPHVDGGSVERWEPQGYGKGDVNGGPYASIWRGEWEEWDPWDAAARMDVVSSLFDGIGQCSMFRMAQGWLSMSEVHAGQGHLLVNPMLKETMAYILLRPFFEAKRSVDDVTDRESFLAKENWSFAPDRPYLEGATCGKAQEAHELLHPHLALSTSMVHVPSVRPGDYVAWHCDTIHAVDAVHAGTQDSSALYIPVCPLTPQNAAGLARQRTHFLRGTPSPDQGGGVGESEHVGRGDLKWMEENGVGVEGMRAMGLVEWDENDTTLGLGEKEAILKANKRLGFYD